MSDQDRRLEAMRRHPSNWDPYAAPTPEEEWRDQVLLDRCRDWDGWPAVGWAAKVFCCAAGALLVVMILCLYLVSGVTA